MQTNIIKSRHLFVGTQRFIMVFFRRKIALIGAVGALLFIIIAVFAPLIAPHDPYEQHLNRILEPPSKEFLLGTDQFGRDLLSRLIFGAQISLLISVIAVGLSASFGTTMGLIAGYFSGWPNTIIMRLTDSLMSIPPILLMIAIGGILGGGLRNLIIVLSIGILPQYIRLMCGMSLTVKECDYVTASRAAGAKDLRLLLVHVLPNCLPQLIVLMTLALGLTILAEAGLSFLGLGIEVPKAAWGSMVTDGYRFLQSRPLISLAPGICIMVVVICFSLAGDGLRDALDPRLRGTI